MTSNTPIHLQPRWRFNYRFDAPNTEDYSSLPTSEQVKNLYIKSRGSTSQPRQILFYPTPIPEASNDIPPPSRSLVNSCQHVSMKHTKETENVEHGKIKLRQNTFTQNLNNEWNLPNKNIEHKSSFQNNTVEKKYQCIERLNSQMSRNVSLNPFPATTIPAANAKETEMNSDSFNERHVILPGGMYANLSDVYVESLPNYTKGDKGSCLVMSLSNVLKKSDMLEKYYFTLKEENRQLQSMIKTLRKQISNEPVSLASTSCETITQHSPNTKKTLDAKSSLNSKNTATMKTDSLKQAKPVQISLPKKKATAIPTSSYCQRAPMKSNSNTLKVTRPKASSNSSMLSKHTSKQKYPYKKI